MDNIVPFAKDDIISIIKQCKSNKVKFFKFGELQLEFHESTDVPPAKRLTKKGRELDLLDQRKDEAEIEQALLDEAMIIEPILGEQMMMDRLTDERDILNGETA